MNNFQRKNSRSNAHVGKEFEILAREYLIENKVVGELVPLSLEIGFQKKKQHKFDWGNQQEKVLVECKSHTWTKGKNTPIAKMTTWDQAMLYFSLAPKKYRKIFWVLKSWSEERGETLCEYYLRTHANVIPDGIEFWEYDPKTKKAEKK